MMQPNLIPEQNRTLQSMEIALGLAADLTHGTVTIYLPHQDPKLLTVYKQEFHILHNEANSPNMTGRIVRSVEEPLVHRALVRNMQVKGMREYSLGEFYKLYVYPLRNTMGKCFGAIAFEAPNLPEDITDQVFDLLQNLNPLDYSRGIYQRLSINDGVLFVDSNKLIIFANNAAKHIFTMMEIPNIVGRHTNDVAINWPLIGMVMDTGIGESKGFYMHGLTLKMRVIPVIPRPKAGNAVVILQDITELKKKDEELLIKSVVIKEIHHRVKNNLQTITSLLRLQERRAVQEETKSVLRDCIGRVNSIAIVHEYLSQQDSGLIDVTKVAKGIYNAIIGSMLSLDFHLEASFESDEVMLPSEKAVNIALIINELLQNAIEHGFENRNSGVLVVNFAENPSSYSLTVYNDGQQLPEGFEMTGRKSLGLKIIKTMAEADLRGSFTLENDFRGGVLATVLLPK